MRSLSEALFYAIVGWAGCAAVMALGPLIFSMQTTLIVHAIVGPLLFGALAWGYQCRIGVLPVSPMALIFIGFVIVVDFFVVSLLILGNLDMFSNWLGTWLPFSLIFLVSWITANVVRAKNAVDQ